MKNLVFKALFFIFFFLFSKDCFSKYAYISSNNFTDLVVRVADTINEKQKGLMNVDSLKNSNGMLFLYKKPKVLKMWMHKTIIPLDIIFIDKFNEVLSVNYGEPFSKEIISSKELAIAVLEIPFGCAEKLMIEEGMKINWRTIKKRKKNDIIYYHCLDN